MRTSVLFGVLLLVVQMPGFCNGEQFDDKDLLPQPDKLDFDMERIYFKVPSYGRTYDGVQPEEWYALDRVSYAIKQLPGPPDEDAKGIVVLQEAMGRAPSAGGEMIYLQTGDGDEYTSFAPYCDYGKTVRSYLKHGGQELSYFKRYCTGVGAVEKSGALLLVGGHLIEEDGGDRPDDWVAVLDTATHQEVDSLPFTATVIRLDPFTHRIWMLGPDGIMLLDASAKPLQRWYFYRGFGPSDHRETLMLAGEPHDSDPFAVLAWALHVTDATGWYAAVQALPEAVRRDFTTYKFFTNASVLADWKSPALRPLLPFLIGPMRVNLDDIEYERVFWSICNYPDPRVDDLVRAMLASPHAWDASTGKQCAATRAKDHEIQ